MAVHNRQWTPIGYPETKIAILCETSNFLVEMLPALSWPQAITNSLYICAFMFRTLSLCKYSP